MSVANTADVSARVRTQSQDAVVALGEKIDRSKQKFIELQPPCYRCYKTAIVWKYAGLGALAGTGTGALVGSAVPGIGTLAGIGGGAVVGGAIGAVVGIRQANLIIDGEYQVWLKQQSEETRRELLDVISRSGKFEFAECTISKETCWIPMRSMHEPKMLFDRSQLYAYWNRHGMFHPGLSANVEENRVKEEHFGIDCQVMVRMNQEIRHMFENIGDSPLTAKQREGLEILMKDQERFLMHCYKDQMDNLNKQLKERTAREGETLDILQWHAAQMMILGMAFRPS